MSVTQVIESCRQRDIKLGVKDGKLVIKDAGKKLTQELMAQLKAHKQDILDWLLRGDAKSDDRIGKVPREGDLPLSYAQQGLWFIDQLEGGSPQYNMPMAFTLNGELDFGALARALTTVVARHEVLRTTFRQVEGESCQIIHEAGKVPLAAIDLSGLVEADQQRLARSLASAETKIVFDLTRDLMLRCRVLHLSGQRHVVLFTLHHVAADGVSMGILVREINILFEAFSAGRPNPLPDLEIQYADYASWQRRQCSEDMLSKALAYWKEQLADIPPIHSLPLDKPRPAQQRFEGAVFQHHVDAGLLNRLRQLASAQEVTLFILLQSAFAILLGRLSNTADVVMGVPNAGRPRRELAPLIGFFINTLVYRTDLTGNPSFASLLRQSRQTSMDAFANAAIPFEMLVKALRPERSLSCSPIFQLAFSMQTQSVEAAPSGTVELSGFDLDLVIVKYDLELSVAEGKNSLSVVWRYSRDLFEPSSIQQMAACFNELLEGIVSGPDCPILNLPLVGPAGMRTLRQWGRGPEEMPGQHLLTRFAQQVAQHPEATALASGATNVTYRQLDELANRLAGYLKEQEIGAGDRVGLFLPRTCAMMIGIFGIMKAGAAYVPLEVTHSKARLSAMIADAGIEVVLAGSGSIEHLPMAGIDMVLIDESVTDPDWLAEYGGLPDQDVPMEAPVYVIYTSGSTGKPKGVTVSHRGVAEYCQFATGSYFQPENGPRDSLLVTSHCFDISVPSMFLPLISGGTTVLLDEDDPLSALAQRLGAPECPAYLLRMTPTHLHALFALMDDRPLDAAHTFVIGGEALRGNTARTLRRKFPVAKVFNHYGPTETVVGATIFPVGENILGEGGVPIGRPMANTRTYVLNPTLQFVPAGFQGELMIGGTGVTSGYAGRPGLTAEKFLPDPFADGPGARMYRTGDLVTWLPGGVLRFEGRLDDQVKLRGYRIELGEIEKTLAACEGLLEAKVVMAGESENQRLLGFATIDKTFAPQAHAVARLFSSDAWPESKQCLLPNGMEICSHNPAETEFLYKELMEGNTYLKHGIQLKDGDCVFDVGANIGLFSLALLRQFRDLRIHAFEPIRPVFEALDGNATIYGEGRLHTHCLGLSDANLETTFDYYPFASVFSGIQTGDDRNFEKVKAYLANSDGESGAGVSQALIDEMIHERLKTEKAEVSLITLSEHLRQYPVPAIDLLKVDVERSELQVLAGIEPEDWAKIRQIVVEVEDRDGLADRIESLLTGHGFLVVKEQNEVLERTRLVNLYARRDPAEGMPVVKGPVKRWVSRNDLAGAAEALLKAQLPSYMIPSKITFLDAFPRTAHGKLNLKALLALEHETKHTFIAPETGTEKRLAEIWQEVLGLERVGVNESFFELGGHSLLATRVVSAIAKRFHKHIPVRALFEHTSIAPLAAFLDDQPVGDFQKIQPVPRDRKLPLSFAQQRLWFIDRLEGGSSQYNMPAALMLRGPLDLQALKQSLNVIVARHEVLRTRFAVSEGMGHQIIGPARPVPVTLIDLAAMTGARLEAMTGSLAAKCSMKAFDLAGDLMVRCVLLRQNPTSHVLLLTLHHIACDGWSIGLLVSEFMALYRGFLLAEPVRLPPLKIQYADFAAWQRETFKEDVVAQELAYWKAALADIPQLHSLPLDKPRPHRQDFKAGVHIQNLDRELLDALSRLALSEDATLFMVIQSCFALLMGRLSGQTDVVMGTPVAGRTHVDLEPMIGFFINNVVLRTSLAGNPTYRSLLRRARQTALEAFSHQSIPFETLVDALNPDRMLSHAPIFQVTVSVQETGGDRLKLPGLEIGSFNNGYEKIDLDLQITASKSENGLALTWLFATSLFERARIERMAASFECLLRAISKHPETAIGQLPILTAADISQMDGWQGDLKAYPVDQCIHEQFERQVAQTPGAPALVFEGQALTFQELNCQANQVAHYLIEQGVVPDTPVGLCLERSHELIIGMLGILKAGGAYVPLDPDYPSGRLDFMVEDSGLEIVLIQSPLLMQLPSLAEKQLLLMDPDVRHAMLAEYPVENIGKGTIGLCAQHQVYIIYTSGSTGQPKGVMATHEGLVNLVRAEQDYIDVGPGDRVLSRISFSFDPATGHLFSALNAGAAIYLADGHTDLDTFIETNRLTHLSLPASLLGALTCRPLPHLRVVTSGAESCPRELAAKWAQGRTFFNLYGPTEATVISVHARFEGEVERVTIGRPLPNTQCVLLDETFQRVPVGVTGELYLGGAGLTRGYLKRPGLTAERFLPNPYSVQPGSRLYRTGDLVRYQPDGQLQFCGRADDQVKLRGFRIELGEIEAQLRATSAVDDALVTICGQGKDGRLAAFLVLSEKAAAVHESIALDDLKRHLGQKLPGYMVPSAFVIMDKFPLSPAGKVDRSALPAPDFRDQSEFVAPESQTEKTLAALWLGLLGLERVSVTASFFELGGHSLLAMKLISQINERFGVLLDIRQLFEHMTIRRLAGVIDDGVPDQDAGEQALVALNKDRSQPNLFLIPGAGLTLAAYQYLANHLEGGACLRVFELAGLDARQLVYGSMAEMVTALADALKSCQSSGPYRLAGHSFGALAAFELGRHLEGLGDRVDLVMIDSTLCPFEENRQPVSEDEIVTMIVGQYPGMWAIPADAVAAEKRQLVLEGLIRGKLLDPGSAEERFDRFLQICVAQVSMHRKYVPSGKFAGRINVVYSAEGSIQRNLKALIARQQPYCQQQVISSQVGGNHLSMLNQDHAASLTERLTAIFGLSEKMLL